MYENQVTAPRNAITAILVMFAREDTLPAFLIRTSEDVKAERGLSPL